MPDISPTAVDLFCGAGGLSEGLRQAGYSVIGALDADALACEAYKLNHKSTHLWHSDIRRISGAKMMRSLDLKPGTLFLLAACPPCQGFSRMRTRNGGRRVRDRRNDLIFEVLRIIRSLKPISLMLENVPALARNRRFSKFLAALKSLGYRITWDILNTANYGVPQRRHRLVLLASKSIAPQFATADEHHVKVRDAIAALSSPRQSNDPLHNYSVSRTDAIRRRIARIPTNGGSRSALGRRRQLECHKRSNGFKDVYGRMAWAKLAPTITSGCINPSKGRFLHPSANRAITLREAALLQTFPPNYSFPLHRGRYPVATLIGNALPPEFIRRHAEKLITPDPVKKQASLQEAS